MLDVDFDLLAKRSLGLELHGIRIPNELGRDVDLQSVLIDHAVRREVLAFEMHVDRHVMFGASSTNRRDKVDCDNAAPLLDELGGVLGNEEFHDFVTP